MTLTINGRGQEVDGLADTATMTAIVQALALRGDRIAVELNGELAPRTQWDETTVRNGDRLEIVHFVGGGS